MFSRAKLAAYGRSVLAVLAMTLPTAGCERTLTTGVRADAQVPGFPPSEPAPPPAQPTPEPSPTPTLDPIVLEFDLPPDFFTKNGRGEFAVSGFLVGYFRPKDEHPIATVHIPREQVTVVERAGRLTLKQYRLPASVKSIEMRVQTRSDGGWSEWSEPSTPIVLRSGAPAANARKKAGASPRMSLAGIEQFPELAALFKKLVPAEESRSRLLPSFRNLEELATALVICRDQQIAMEKFVPILHGPPRRNLRYAVRQIKTGTGAANVVAGARKQAKALLSKAK